MAIDQALNRDPQGTNRSFGYHSSMNAAPGGALATWLDVTPGAKRITGQSDSARAQRDSISRQYAPAAVVSAVA
jgi:hypothetical protein